MLMLSYRKIAGVCVLSSHTEFLKAIVLSNRGKSTHSVYKSPFFELYFYSYSFVKKCYVPNCEDKSRSRNKFTSQSFFSVKQTMTRATRSKVHLYCSLIIITPGYWPPLGGDENASKPHVLQHLWKFSSVFFRAVFPKDKDSSITSPAHKRSLPAETKHKHPIWKKNALRKADTLHTRLVRPPPAPLKPKTVKSTSVTAF